MVVRYKVCKGENKRVYVAPAQSTRLLRSQTAQNIIEVGKRLIQAKSLVAHGQWQQWLNVNFQLSYESAKKFMAVAERFGEMVIDYRFKPTQLITLLALPDAEETEKFLAEKAAEGKKKFLSG